MDIKDIKRAMDNMPMGDGSALRKFPSDRPNMSNFWMSITARLP